MTSTPICPRCGKPKSDRAGIRPGSIWWQCAPCQNERTRERYQRYRSNRKLSMSQAAKPAVPEPIVIPERIAARPEPGERLEKPRLRHWRDIKDYWEAEANWVVVPSNPPQCTGVNRDPRRGRFV